MARLFKEKLVLKEEKQWWIWKKEPNSF
jgi:hypothetical protein